MPYSQFNPVPWWYYLRPPQTRQGAPTQFSRRPPPQVNPLYQINRGVRGMGSLSNFLFGGEPSLSGLGPLLGTVGYATQLPLLWGSNASPARMGLGTATNLVGGINALSQIPGMSSYFPSGMSSYLGPIGTGLNVGMGALSLAEGNTLGGALQIGTALAGAFLPTPFNIVLPFFGSVLGGQLGKTETKAERQYEEASDFIRTSQRVTQGLSLVSNMEEYNKVLQASLSRHLPGGGRGFEGIGAWDPQKGTMRAAVVDKYQSVVDPARRSVEYALRWTHDMALRADRGDSTAKAILEGRRRSVEMETRGARQKAVAYSQQWGEPLPAFDDVFTWFGFSIPGYDRNMWAGIPMTWADMPGYSPGGGE